MYRKVVRRPEHLQKNLGFHELSIDQHEGRFGRHKLQSSAAQIRYVCDHWMSPSPRPTHKDKSNANWWIMDAMVKEAWYAIYVKNKLCQTPVTAKRVTSSGHVQFELLWPINCFQHSSEFPIKDPRFHYFSCLTWRLLLSLPARARSMVVFPELGGPSSNVILHHQTSCQKRA